MTSGTFNRHLQADDIKRRAAGRWVQILQSVCGLSAEQLNPKVHGPCPKCGGKDRFRALDDVAETGALYCNQCFSTGNGDGLSAIQWLNGCTLPGSLKLVDGFFGNHSSQLNGHHKTKPKKPAKPKPVHATSEKAGEAFAYGLTQSGILPEKREPDEGWPYRHADGTDAFSVVRWNLPDETKTFGQITKVDGGWICGGMPEPRPLYRLPEIIDAAEVWICEGEKSADAAVLLGLQATTSAGGSNAAEKSDWQPLDGKRVCILPDNDEPGEKYATEVVELIRKQAPTATIEVRRLKEDWPEIPDGGDIADWSERFDSSDAETLRARLCSISNVRPDSVGETPVSPASQRVSSTNRESIKIKSLVSEPFPIDCLPSRLSSFVQSVSRAVGCDHSFSALPAMAVVSTAIGNSRRVSTKQGNYQPLSIWPVVIGLSGSQKSEPFDLSTECLNNIENTYEAEFKQASARYVAAIEHYKLELKDWRGSRIGEPPVEPEMPILRQMVVKDTTSEALIKIHSGNPRGLLCCNEELSGWFGSFERYAGKGAVSGEQAKFLEFYDGKRATSDRVTAKRIVIQRSFVNVTGTIQPGIMQKALTSESRSNGLASRLWMAYPPSVLIKWRDEFVSTRTKQSYADLINDLLSLGGQTDATGSEQPALLDLSTDSRKLFAEYMNDTGEQCFVMFGDVRAAWAKFIGRCARLAGIIHCCRQADGDIKDPWTIDTDSMKAAITLCEWSKGETLRVYELLKEDGHTNSLRLLAAWIKHHGGAVTARDLCRYKRDIESSDDAEQWLRNLQDAGFGKYEMQPVGESGGRPTAKFILKSESL